MGDAQRKLVSFLSMLGAVYAFERSIMLERQREGIALAKQAGKYKGRPKTIDNHEIRRILAEGNSISKTASLLGVSMSSVQRAERVACLCLVSRWSTVS